jgi:creatinine amidohydrolase
MGRIAFWGALTAPEIAALDKARAIAVLPVGAIEQHGPHLGTGTDADLAQAVISRALPRIEPGLTVLALPVLPYGKSTEHEAVAGTLSLSATTLLAILDDIGASLARSGIGRLLVLNAHGGNRAVLEIACRDLRARHGLVTALCQWDSLVDTAAIVGAAEAVRGLHGGDVETSAMLSAHPDRVRPALARDFRSAHEDWGSGNTRLGLGRAVVPGWLIGDLSRAGAVGDAASATAAKGAALLDGAAQGLAEALAAFDRFEHEARE